MGEFFGFGEELKHVPYNIPWQVGFSGGVSGSLPRCSPESSPTLSSNPSSRWYNPLNNNYKPSQEDEEA